MLRRRFVSILGGVSIALPFGRAARADTPVIGFLGSASAGQWSDRLRAFHVGLAETGYTEGRNVAVAYRWADGRNDRLPALAAELVALPSSVIAVLGNTQSAVVAKAATSTIPIVFRIAADPVEIGLVASLARPGGNLTGVTTLGVEVGPKQIELLHELVPKASPLGLLVNPTNLALAPLLSKQIPDAARAIGRQIHVVAASTDRELAPAFDRLVALRVGGLIIGVDAFFNSRNETLADLALRNRIPTIAPYREFAIAGGLLSYGGSIAAASSPAGNYVGQILHGKKPGELPVQQTASVELFVNLKTAKALGLIFPAWLLGRADEVIE